MHRFSIRRGMNRYGSYTKLAAGALHAQGNLTTIGNQNF